MRIGFLHSRIRVEERLLIEEFERRGIEFELLDVTKFQAEIHDPTPWQRFDAVFERCVSQTQAVTAVRVLESFGIPCINPSAVIEACGDKLTTSLILARNGIATPRVRVAVDPETALEAIEEMGYPVVLKPAVGSWGRLLARVNDRDAAEAIVEHKSTLGSVQHGVFYIQEHVDKPGRDLRVFVVGTSPIAAIERRSEHWITNTARGGQAAGFAILPAIDDLCRRTARAMAGNAGALLAIDLLESSDGRVLVSEVNHTMEFRNSIATTGVDIPGRMIDYVLGIAEKQSVNRVSHARSPVPAAAGLGVA
ncbi:MAG: lysine biosynthesis protein LysX [Phycisphaeraceae bacterium]|nr:lysine biosynthesis protein LysX [Phycisphaeraceae bacterium]